MIIVCIKDMGGMRGGENGGGGSGGVGDESSEERNWRYITLLWWEKIKVVINVNEIKL